jgi:hypothetical protein
MDVTTFYHTMNSYSETFMLTKLKQYKEVTLINTNFLPLIMKKTQENKAQLTHIIYITGQYGQCRVLYSEAVLKSQFRITHG